MALIKVVMCGRVEKQSIDLKQMRVSYLLAYLRGFAQNRPIQLWLYNKGDDKAVQVDTEACSLMPMWDIGVREHTTLHVVVPSVPAYDDVSHAPTRRMPYQGGRAGHKRQRMGDCGVAWPLSRASSCL